MGKVRARACVCFRECARTCFCVCVCARWYVRLTIKLKGVTKLIRGAPTQLFASFSSYFHTLTHTHTHTHTHIYIYGGGESKKIQRAGGISGRQCSFHVGYLSVGQFSRRIPQCRTVFIWATTASDSFHIGYLSFGQFSCRLPRCWTVFMYATSVSDSFHVVT